MKPSACCCRAFCIPKVPTPDRVLGWARATEDDLADLLASGRGPEDPDLQMAWDNALMLSNLDPLPADFALWPVDSKSAAMATGLDAEEIEGLQFFRCLALGPDGLCSIYASRPYICRNFEPQVRCAGCASFDPRSGSCRPSGAIAFSIPPLEPVRALEDASSDA